MCMLWKWSKNRAHLHTEDRAALMADSSRTFCASKGTARNECAKIIRAGYGKRSVKSTI